MLIADQLTTCISHVGVTERETMGCCADKICNYIHLLSTLECVSCEYKKAVQEQLLRTEINVVFGKNNIKPNHWSAALYMAP